MPGRVHDEPVGGEVRRRAKSLGDGGEFWCGFSRVAIRHRRALRIPASLNVRNRRHLDSNTMHDITLRRGNVRKPFFGTPARRTVDFEDLDPRVRKFAMTSIDSQRMSEREACRLWVKQHNLGCRANAATQSYFLPPRGC